MSDKYNKQDGLVDADTGLLKNKLGITDTKALDQAQNQALLETYRYAAIHYSDTHPFSVEDVCALHRRFLGGFFDWAGTYRTVDISSKDIRWCHAAHIFAEMKKYNALLQENTPFSPEWTRQELLEKLAKVHGELVVIHPFRDGNGRTTRLLCNLLLLQAGRKTLAAQGFYERREEYFTAIQEVWRNINYANLVAFLDLLLEEPV